VITDIIHTPLFRGLKPQEGGVYFFMPARFTPLPEPAISARLDLIPMLSLDMSPVMALLNT